MTKQDFIELADYNIWANDIVHSWLDKITDEQWQQPIVSSFPSLSATALHTAAAETVWLDRLIREAEPRWLAKMLKGGKEEVQEAWRKSSTGLQRFVVNVKEADLPTILQFKRIDGSTHELLQDQILAHVFNHSTYHRGQIVTMLRQTGFTSLHSIDMSTYFWSKKN